MKKTIILAFAILFSFAVSAADRTEKEMKAVARQQLNKMMPVSTRGGGAGEVSKLTDSDFYSIYGTENAFVVVSKDTRHTPVLAYSAKPYKPDRIPCGLQWWFGAMEEALSESVVQSVAMSPSVAVEPLLATEWGQGNPFNLKCPTLNGEKAPSGCVATAMSQVLNFFKYPETGKGRGSYTVMGGFRPWSLTLGTTYHYDLLKNKYDETTLANLTPEEEEAISTLLLHCGAAVKMNYNSDGSGAYDYDATDGLATHFRYDSLAIHCYQRNHFTNDEWMQMLLAELEARHPVIYCGQDPRAGGHAFVVDGVNNEGLVHVNWGWDGDCDGYYSLEGLTPKRTVGFSFGYNFSSGQSMIVGYKLQEKSDEQDEYHSFWASSTAYTLKASGSNFVVTDLGGFYNYNWLPFEGSIALVFEEDKNNGQQYDIIFDEEKFGNYKGIRMWGYSSNSTDLIPFVLINNKQIPAGNYKVFLGSKDIKENAYRPFRCGGGVGAIYFNVTKNPDGTFTLDGTRRQYITTGIVNTTTTRQPDGRIYDLNGRFVGWNKNSLPKGIYIINGEKVVIR